MQIPLLCNCISAFHVSKVHVSKPQSCTAWKVLSRRTENIFRNIEIISGFKCQLNGCWCCRFHQVALVQIWQEVILHHHLSHKECHQALRDLHPCAPGNTTVSNGFDSWFSSCVSCWNGLKINVFHWWMWLPRFFWSTWWLSSVLIAAVNMQAKQRCTVNIENNQIIWFWWRCVKL